MVVLPQLYVCLLQATAELAAAGAVVASTAARTPSMPRVGECAAWLDDAVTWQLPVVMAMYHQFLYVGDCTPVAHHGVSLAHVGACWGLCAVRVRAVLR